jgi:16S rRNA (cytosine967-C5)-methyltransferase
VTRRKRRRTAGRPAQGRERGARAASGEPRWLTCVLDAWAEHRATGAPLDRVLKQRGANLRLGPRDRARARELGFGLARWGSAAFSALEEAQRAYGGMKPSRRDLDRAGVALAAVAAELEPVRVDVPAPLDAVVEDAIAYGPGAVLGDRPRLPRWLQKRLEARFGDRAKEEIDALLTRAPITLAVDPRAHKIDDVIARLQEKGIPAAPSPISPTGIRCEKRVPPSLLQELGGVWPMDDGSQRVVHAMEVKAGDLVLDICSGGGGKSRLLQALGAVVISADVDAARLRTTPEGSARVHADGARPPFAAGAFDAVLVDAPCTGTGTLRRAPDRAQTLGEDEVDAFAELQTALLRAAAPLVRAGGTLVYATCSLLREEDEAVVDDALDDLDVEGPGEREVLTPASHGSDGFFLSRFRRRAAAFDAGEGRG